MSRITKKGLSMIEVIVATGIFAIAMTAIAGSFVSFILAYRKTRATQQRLEDAQYASSYMAKVLRTSAATLSGSSVMAWDYSQEKCLKFEIDATTKELKQSSAAAMQDSECNSSAAFGVAQTLATNVSGRMLTNGSMLTIQLLVDDGQGAVVPVQTSVAMRNLVEVSP